MSHDKDLENFKKTFGDLLKDTNEEAVPEADTKSDMTDSYGASDAETEYEHEPSEMEQEEMMMSIEELTVDPDHEAHAARMPLPPMTRESEARAVAIGLQEIRKIREYMLYSSRHMFSEFERIYTLYPLMMSLDFEQHFTAAHTGAIELLKESEHLIAGDIHLLKEVKADYRLVQAFEEKRLSLLYRLLERYDN